MKTAPQDRLWDVIVVGTGQGGATAGYALARSGLSVLFIEKGRSSLTGEAALRGDFAEVLLAQAEPRDASEGLRRAGRWSEPLLDVSSGRSRAFVPVVGCGTGGSSALFGMALERLAEEDFTPRRHYGDAADSTLPERWPVGLEELGPFYEAAEELFGVHGTRDPLRGGGAGALRSPPPLSAANGELFEHLRRVGAHPYRLPMACDYAVGDDRSQGFLDATGAKRDVSRVCLEPAVRDHGALVLDQCDALRLEHTRERVSEVVCHRHGQLLALRGRVVLLAAGALATPALLLNSSSPLWPNGLANHSGLVGSNLMRHHIDLYVVRTAARETAHGNCKQLACNDLYARDGLKLGTLQSFGAMPPPRVISAELRQSLPRWLDPGFALVAPLLERALRGMFAGKVVLASIMEDLPYEGNRVLLTGERDDLGRRRSALRYRVSAADERRGRLFRREVCALLSPYRVQVVKQGHSNKRIAHACGTCRFGEDPRTSVLDPYCKAHSVENLYVVDASFFPSSGGTNPGLTVAANALRVAARISATWPSSLRTAS